MSGTSLPEGCLEEITGFDNDDVRHIRTLGIENEEISLENFKTEIVFVFVKSNNPRYP